MKNDEIYLTFKTDRYTHEMLKLIAHELKISQPKLINQLCIDFIKMLDEEAYKQLLAKGYTEEEIKNQINRPGH